VTFQVQNSDFDRVLVITGSGISADSGIPTFRGKDGYWRNLDPEKLATPQAFRNDPQLVWRWYSERREKIANAQPNAAHLALVSLEQRAGEFLLVTQNVDDLHRRAGTSPEKLVQVHGNIFVSRCRSCGFFKPDCSSHEFIPICPKCSNHLSPGVVWFGEQLPQQELLRVHQFLARGPSSLVLVIGTTARFDYIADWALRSRGQRGRLIEINPIPVFAGLADDVIRERASIALPALFTGI
jgi:NAD-dependent protein deacetylase/lipoamidase